MNDAPLVHIVDDDEAVRKFLGSLVSSIGLEVAAYSSALEFLDTFEADRTGCILLDVRMPGMSELQLQKELVGRNCPLPLILLTGHGDVQMAVQAMKAGAFDFFEKPFNNQMLLDSLQKAVAESRGSEENRRGQAKAVELLARLTPREREVTDLVALGEINKVIAAKLGISEKTVEVHRARGMEKLKVSTLAELIRLIRT